MSFDKVAVIGLGYIGLPTAAILASRGIDVLGVDISQHAVDTINQGNIHIVEPDLDIVVRSAVNTGKLRASTQAESADAFMIAVPTPFKENKVPDLSYIKAAAETIAPVLKSGDLVVLESTSPVGTTEKLAQWLSSFRTDLTFPQDAGDQSDIRVAHCPERVLPGYVLQELVSNDRVIGGLSTACSEVAGELYKTFVKGECVVTNARTAEMAKLTENSFRDVNIAFANELSLICDKLDINVWELIGLSNRHPRVDILKPGPGVGGHCIAVDPWFIVDSAPEEALLIRQAREVNDYKPDYIVKKVMDVAAKLEAPVIGCLGLAFKADIDDLRESPAVEITKKLAASGVGRVLAAEPNVSALPESLVDLDITLSDYNTVITQSDIIVVLVDHAQFKVIDTHRLLEKIVIDSRGIYI